MNFPSFRNLLPIISAHFPSGRLCFYFKQDHFTTPIELCSHGKMYYYFCLDCFEKWKSCDYQGLSWDLQTFKFDHFEKKETELKECHNKDQLTEQVRLLQFLLLAQEDFDLLFNVDHLKDSDRLFKMVRHSFLITDAILHIEWKKTWHLINVLENWRQKVQSNRQCGPSCGISRKTFDLCSEFLEKSFHFLRQISKQIPRLLNAYRPSLKGHFCSVLHLLYAFLLVIWGFINSIYHCDRKHTEHLSHVVFHLQDMKFLHILSCRDFSTSSAFSRLFIAKTEGKK